MIVAIINDNIITEIKTVTEEEYSNLHCQLAMDISNENPVPQVGWTFDGSKLVGVSISTKITRLAMRQRFSVSELMALENAALTNMFVKVLLGNLSVATFIDLQRPDTVAGIQALVSMGLLTSARAAIILNTQSTEIEIYRGI